jgi:hypothetical protein
MGLRVLLSLGPLLYRGPHSLFGPGPGTFDASKHNLFRQPPDRLWHPTFISLTPLAFGINRSDEMFVTLLDGQKDMRPVARDMYARVYKS